MNLTVARMAASTPGAAVAAKPRTETKNASDPRGQFGAFLRHWIDKHLGGDEKRLADKLDLSDRTIRKWIEGANGPAFQDLDRIALAMGYSDWGALASAAVRYAKK